MKLAVIFLFVSVVIATPSGTKPILERASGTESALRPRDTYPVVKAISRDPAVNGTFLTGLDGNRNIYLGPASQRKWVKERGETYEIAFPPFGVEHLYLVVGDSATSFKPVLYSTTTGKSIAISDSFFAVPDAVYEGYYQLFIKNGTGSPTGTWSEATLEWASG